MIDQLPEIIARIADSAHAGLIVQAFAFAAYSGVIVEAIRSPRRASIYAASLATAAFLGMIVWSF